MARFVVNTPITTREATVVVDAGLPIGVHRFRLEVIDAAGNRSRPSDAIVQVQRIVVGPVIPTPIDPVRPVLDPRTPIRPTGRSVSPSRRPRARRKKEQP
jgi:hypothetical protein